MQGGFAAFDIVAALCNRRGYGDERGKDGGEFVVVGTEGVR
jgi:hypothetical protein